jgi:hypothetical protein
MDSGPRGLISKPWRHGPGTDVLRGRPRRADLGGLLTAAGADLVVCLWPPVRRPLSVKWPRILRRSLAGVAHVHRIGLCGEGENQCRRSVSGAGGHGVHNVHTSGVGPGLMCVGSGRIGYVSGGSPVFARARVRFESHLGHVFPKVRGPLALWLCTNQLFMGPSGPFLLVAVGAAGCLFPCVGRYVYVLVCSLWARQGTT